MNFVAKKITQRHFPQKFTFHEKYIPQESQSGQMAVFGAIFRKSGYSSRSKTPVAFILLADPSLLACGALALEACGWSSSRARGELFSPDTCPFTFLPTYFPLSLWW